MQTIQLSLSPEQAADDNAIRTEIAKTLSVDATDISSFRIVRKSIDARGRRPVVILQLNVFVGEQPDRYAYFNTFDYHDVTNAKEVIVVGSGPAGLFAALRLIELGLRPIIVERGKTVDNRTIDVDRIYRNEELNEESNICFGEGGAGTFSDGKLFSRSKKSGKTGRILEIFHRHGAQDGILYDAHPHIGTDVLQSVVANIRKTILQCGGEMLFSAKVIDILLQGDRVTGVRLADNRTLNSDYVVLATGHSARDIYRILTEKRIAVEAKGFAMGVRVEHPQELIDKIQYKGYKNDFLPAASYNLTAQFSDRGVYSFCMCPGGMIVPSATERRGVVVNGMSNSQRNSPFANSGIVVQLHPKDLSDFHQYGELCGLYFQQHLEHLAYVNNGGQNQKAPAQRLDDFVKGKLSGEINQSSYLPGTVSSPMHFWLPSPIGEALREGFKIFDRKMSGFVTSQAVALGVESRTSSPVRIPRHRDTLQHTQIAGLYPCGEGAGYSGGITSSAIDGERVAEQIKLDTINNRDAHTRKHFT